MNERQNKIVDIIAQNKKIRVKDLAAILKVSEVTIRKDLQKLEDAGFLQRVHGYACINDSDDINKRMIYALDRKRKIAAKALEFVKDGETVMIESGSSCILFAEMLAENKKDLRIITNSVFLAHYLRKNNNVSIILLGGEYQKEAEVTVGPLIAQSVNNFNVDKFFIGADGYIKDGGFTGNDFMRAQAVKDMAKKAREVYVLTDSYKFSKSGVVNILTLKDIHAVITDDLIDEDALLNLESNGVRVYKV